MQINLGKTIAHEPYKDVAGLREIIRSCVNYVFLKTEYEQNHSKAVYYIEDCVAALEQQLPSILFEGYVFDHEVGSFVTADNLNAITYKDDQDFMLARSNSIADCFWPFGQSWYVPLWEGKANLARILRRHIDVEKSINAMRRDCTISVMHSINRLVKNAIDDIESKVFITNKIAERYAFLIRFRDVILDEILIENNQKLQELLSDKIPDFAVSLFELLGNFEKAFKAKVAMSDSLYDQLYAKALAREHRGIQNEWLVACSYSKTNARKIVRMSGEHSRDFLRSFMDLIGRTDVFNQGSKSPEDQLFKSGHGSYLIG